MNIKYQSIACAIVLAVGVSSAEAATLSLTGTVRDFSDTHPDFESTIRGLETGAVESTLDNDGKPVLSSQGLTSAQFSRQSDFYQWFRTVDGVNESRDLTINLSDTNNDGLFKYASNSFFPIDGMLMGNEGRSHNYHFTYEISGYMSFNAEDTFSFSGDDDLWVFVGGELAMDLGGVHGPASAQFTGADLLLLGLAEGDNHEFSIFFAERHTTQSNFAITTSIAFDAPGIVPLPASFPLLLAGLGAFGILRRYQS